MKKIKNILVKVLLPAVLLILPLAALAQTGGGAVQDGLRSVWSVFPHTGLAGANTVTGLIALILRWLLIIAGAIAVLFVVIGGYQYLTSAGNEEQAEKGRKTLTNAVIGIVIIILSYVIINVVVNLVSGYGTGLIW